MNIEREHWLNKRNKGIGGSDAASIIGLNPYMTNEELWEIKTGRKVQSDISEKPYVKYGVEAEPLLINLFALDFPEYQIIHKDFDIVYNDEHDFLLASLDGRIIDEKGRTGILEIKTSELRTSSDFDKWKDRVPDNYFCQILHYLMVTGFDFAVLKAQLKIGMSSPLRLETRHYFFERTDFIDDIKELKAKEIEFWQEYVLKDIRPPLILPQV